MQIHCKYTGVKGFVKLYEYGLKWRHMITDKAKHKAKVLSFWNKYGIEATTTAFGIQRRTLYNWKSQLKKGQGKLESLNEKSRRPLNVRKREWSFVVREEIKRLRKEHPNLGPDKIAVLLKQSSKSEIKNQCRCPKLEPSPESSLTLRTK